MTQFRFLYLSALERVLLATRRRALPQHLEMGERGELVALFHLRRQGYVVVARRWRTPRQRGDVDLIAWEGDTLCFVEVKTRGGRAVASAESAVDEDKRKLMRRIARQYMKVVEPPAQSSVRCGLGLLRTREPRADTLPRGL
jgi:Holliday junction resolvase-like predicted endonuclease